MDLSKYDKNTVLEAHKQALRNLYKRSLYLTCVSLLGYKDVNPRTHRDTILALESDANTVAAVKFHDHDETPGFGANIEKESWTRHWGGKEISDAAGAIVIEVVKGRAKGVHEVDGISGATRTGNGISKLIRFWLGPDGYGPYLNRLRRGEMK